MKMTKRVLLSILALLLVLGLVACGGAAEEEETAAPPEETAAPAEETTAPEEGEEEAVSIRLWTHQNPTFNEGYEALIAAYEQANPNVDIILETFEYDLYIQTLQTAMPAGEEADVLQLFGTWTAEYAERLVPVAEDVMTVAEAQELYYAAPIGGFIIDGVLYGMPQEYNIEYGGVLVNKTMYEAAGLAYPPEWNSMDDVLTDAQALVQIDDAGMMAVSGFHFASSDAAVFSFLAGIRQRGGDYWNDDMTGFTFNTPEAAEALGWMIGAITEWGVSDPVLFEDAENWVGDAFFESRVGIGYIGPWAISMGLYDFPDFEDEWDYFVLPAFEGDPVFVADSGWGLVVSPNSEHQDVAWDFVTFVTADPTNAAQWSITSSTIPAIPEVAESADVTGAMPFITRELAQLPYGSYLGSMPDRDLVVYEIVYPHILSALQGLETVDEALEMMDAEANATFE
jgi:multiple sugar transport system substrate-binding protein